MRHGRETPHIFRHTPCDVIGCDCKSNVSELLLEDEFAPPLGEVESDALLFFDLTMLDNRLLRFDFVEGSLKG